ncbi:MAG: hypothetical protein JHD16_18910 [Solirubrobacteraceae bacterium]|nr:hypothetical protein [Solirubrobacteraceae bacterium]
MRPLLTAVLLALTTLVAATAPASGAAMIGMGDQNVRMFDDVRFTSLTKVKVVRYIAPWDVENDPVAKAKAEAWIAAAKSKGYLIHFTFNYGVAKPLVNPTPAAYVAATKPFVARHRSTVESWGVFNEVNRGLAAGRFTTPNAKLAAKLFLAFRSQVCVGCKVVAIDLLDGVNVKPTLTYLRTFMRAVGKNRPKIVGFHNYSDTNRNSMTRTAALVKAVGKAPKVWITETGGLYKFGRDGSGFLPDAKRQANSVRQVFKIAKKFPRIERTIFYNFYGPGEDRPDDIFDAGLISGVDTIRPAYTVFKSFAQ